MLMPTPTVRKILITTTMPAFTLTATAGTVFAEPPNEHRDFPIDTFGSDETYTISAWAINDDDEVISPVVTLKVRPKDTARGDDVDWISWTTR